LIIFNFKAKRSKNVEKYFAWKGEYATVCPKGHHFLGSLVLAMTLVFRVLSLALDVVSPQDPLGTHGFESI
jgi:hypothetical protein